jgi:hypothetical protein
MPKPAVETPIEFIDKRKASFQGVPPCSSLEQYKEWLGAYRASRLLGNKKICGFCADCLPDYANAMREQGRCEYTDIVFEEDSEGGIVGVFSNGDTAEYRKAK